MKSPIFKLPSIPQFSSRCLLALAVSAALPLMAEEGTWSGGLSGTWDTSDTNWTGLTAGTPWDSTNGLTNNATFSTDTVNATVSGAVTANNIVFTLNGTVSGGNVTLGGTTPGISVASGQVGTVSSVLAGTGGLIKSGAGTLVLSGTNTYNGTTTITAGTLAAGSSSAFTNKGPLTMANAAGVVFDLAGFNASITNLTAGNATNSVTTTGAGSGTDTLTITALSAGTNANFSDNGTRKLALNITAVTGTFDVLGNTNNTFSGGLTLGNNVRLTPANNSVTTGGKFGRGTITIGTVAGSTTQLYYTTANVTIENPLIVNTAATVGSRTGAFRVDSTGNVLSGQITANLADAVFINGSAANGSMTLTGQVTGARGLQVNSNSVSNPLTLTFNNAGTANDYAGNTSVGNFSTLILAAANQIPNGAGKGNLTVTGTLNLNGYSETVNGLGGAGTIDNVLATGGSSNTLTVGDNNVSGQTFSGTIKNTAGSLAVTKTGSGTFALSGNNSFSGGLTVGGTGAVTLSNSNAAGTGTIAVQTTSAGTGSILVLSGNLTVANNITMNSSSGRNNIGSSAGTNALTGNITITNTGSNIHIIQNNSSSNGSLTVGKADFSNTISAATFANNLSFRGSSTGGGVINSVISAPSMTVDFNASVTNWTINSTGNNWGATTGILGAGNLILGATNALDPGAKLDHSSAGDLDLNGFNQSIAGLNRAAAVVGAQITNNSATTDSVLTLAGLTTDYIYANVIADGATRKVSVVMNSVGRTQTFNGTNTYSGDTTISAGKIALGSALALQYSAFNTTGSTAGVGLDVTGFSSPTLGGLSGSVDLATAIVGGYGNVTTVTLNPQSGSVTYSGAIADGAAGMALTKSGAGTQVLDGANTYTGNTTVTAGTLLLASSGSLAAGSPVDVNAGEFGGSGTGNGAVAVASGATLVAGTSLVDNATFTLTGNLTMAPGSIVSLGLGAGGTHDSFNLTGSTILFDGTQSFAFLDQGAAPGLYSGIITGLVSAPDVSNWTVSNASWTGTFSLNGNDVDFTLTAVPEPASWLLALAGLVGLAFLDRRRIKRLLADTSRVAGNE